MQAWRLLTAEGPEGRRVLRTLLCFKCRRRLRRARQWCTKRATFLFLREMASPQGGSGSDAPSVVVS